MSHKKSSKVNKERARMNRKLFKGILRSKSTYENVKKCYTKKYVLSIVIIALICSVIDEKIDNIFLSTGLFVIIFYIFDWIWCRKHPIN